jgi:DNA-directed RNA polymerase subunit N (RpoN/RPB10)
MIIPIRCQTCGKEIASMWEYYVKRCKEIEEKNNEEENKDNLKYFEKHFKKEIFDELKLTRYCCKRHFLGQVDLIETI